MALASLQATVLQVSHLSLPFRLYGAMGARIGGAALDSPYLVDELIVKALQHEREAMARGCEEHSSINRYVPSVRFSAVLLPKQLSRLFFSRYCKSVMLAMCLLCPGALGRRPNDPVLTLM